MSAQTAVIRTTQVKVTPVSRQIWVMLLCILRNQPNREMMFEDLVAAFVKEAPWVLGIDRAREVVSDFASTATYLGVLSDDPFSEPLRVL